MARGRPYRFARFARGLNTADGPYGLREGFEDDPSGLGAECRAALNVVSRRRGNVSRRNGCVELFTTASTDAIKDISVVGQDTGSFAVCSTDAGRLLAASVDTPATVTELVASGLDDTAPWTFLRLPEGGGQGPAFGMNAVDAPKQTDGTLAGTGAWTASTGTVPNGSLMAYHDTTLWVAGVTSAAYSLYWSNIGDPRDWPVANVTKFNPDDGGPITALCSAGPYLLVFKERGIWAVYDSETSANRKFADGAGTLAPRSVVATEMGCFFLDSERGVMQTDAQNTTRVSEQIQPIFDQVAQSDMASASAAFLDGHYYLSVKVAGVWTILDYDTELKSWWVHSPTIRALATWDRGAGPLLLGANLAGAAWHMFKDGVTLDDDVIYEARWSGPFHTFRAPQVRKRVRELHMEGRGSVDVYLATDYELGQGGREGAAPFTGTGTRFGVEDSFGGIGVFGGGVQIGEQSLYSLGVGRAWSVTFYSASASAFEIDAYTLLTEQRKD